MSRYVPQYAVYVFKFISFSAPRFIVKYWSTVYQPLDKDIVREMWVEGNLKDQLGLKHRKARRNRSTSESPLESAPMFRDQHNGSLSELENARYPFDSTGHSSPESDVAAKMVYPPMSET
jgi:phospholipid-translocating ATPase